MRKIEEILEEMKPLMGCTDPESRSRLACLEAELETRQLNPEEQAVAQTWWRQGIDEARQDIDRLRNQINEDYKLLPIKYIAQHYFGRSASWLYQRLNGNRVRGRIYTLNEEQKATFNRALQDISEKIRSLSIV